MVLETLFAVGFALMAAAVIGSIVVFAISVLGAVLWLPFKILGWFAMAVGTVVGGIICLVLLPFAIAGALLGIVLAIVFSPPFLLLVIGVLAWMLHSRRDQAGHLQLPEAPTQA